MQTRIRNAYISESREAAEAQVIHGGGLTQLFSRVLFLPAHWQSEESEQNSFVTKFHRKGGQEKS